MRDQDGAQVPVRERPSRTLRIITFEGSFHGRTLATLAAGKQKKYLEGFGPVVDGFDQVPLGDIEAVKRAIGPETAAHPDRAGAGRRRCPRRRRRSFCARCGQLCDEHGLLLAFDEVQTGIGRLGELFGYQKLGVTPDVMGSPRDRLRVSRSAPALPPPRPRRA